MLLESELAPTWRDLLLAANYSVRGREEDAIERITALISKGFDLSWGAYCEFAAMQETVLLKPLHGSEAMLKLSEYIKARSREMRPNA